MGIRQVEGWEDLGLAACYVVIAARQLIAVRRGARAKASSLEWMVFWLIGACAFIVTGTLFLRLPHGLRGPVGWIPALVFFASPLAFVVPWIVRRRGNPPDDTSAVQPEQVTAPDDHAANLIARIENAKFSTKAVGLGYDERDVDKFLDGLVADLRRDGLIDPASLREVRFSRTRLRPGYAKADVDAFLAGLEQVRNLEH